MFEQNALIELKDISYKSILTNIDLEICHQKILTIIGPNGAGKTTLLKIILGLIKPQTGYVTRKAHLKIGYMPQKIMIDKSLPLTVERFLKLSPQKGYVNDALTRVGIQNLRYRSLHVLSGGELQRVLLGRAIMGLPDLLVLDEPVQGIDIAGQAEVYHLIQSVRNHLKCGVLLVSHDLHFVHAASDHVICLNQHICCQGHPEIVKHDPAYTQLFGLNISDDLAPYHHHHDHLHV